MQIVSAKSQFPTRIGARTEFLATFTARSEVIERKKTQKPTKGGTLNFREKIKKNKCNVIV